MAHEEPGTLLKQAGNAVFSLVLFQTISRLITFALNTLILRFTSPLVLGIAGIKLDLLMGTILYLSRDAFRMALVRMPSPKASDQHAWTRIFSNTTYLCLPIAVITAGILSVIYLQWPPAEVLDSEILLNAYKKSVLYYIIATLVELTCEPIVMMLIYNQETRARIGVQLIGMVAKMGTVLVFVLRSQRHKASFASPEDHILLGLEAFSTGQLAYSVALAAGYLRIFQREPIFKAVSFVDILPSFPFRLDASTVKLALELNKQLILKYVLAQGDMWVVSSLCKVSDQGIFSVVSNYGSLVCRLLLQPLEESSLQFFSRSFRRRIQQPLRSISKAEVEANLQEISKMKAAFQHLVNILKLDIFLSMAFIFLAPFYTRPLVWALLGSRWAHSSMPIVLAAYCLQIPAMAFCGILEAFMNATISAEWFSTARRNSALISIIYGASAICLVKRYDTVGLIGATCLSFALRAGQGFYYLLDFIDGIEGEVSVQLRMALLHPLVCGAFILSGIGCGTSMLFSSEPCMHLLVGVFSTGLIGLACYIKERPFLRSLYQTYVKQHKLPNT